MSRTSSGHCGGLGRGGALLQGARGGEVGSGQEALRGFSQRCDTTLGWRGGLAAGWACCVVSGRDGVLPQGALLVGLADCAQLMGDPRVKDQHEVWSIIIIRGGLAALSHGVASGVYLHERYPLAVATSNDRCCCAAVPCAPLDGRASDGTVRSDHHSFSRRYNAFSNSSCACLTAPLLAGC